MLDEAGSTSGRVKVLLIRPPRRRSVDMGDILKIARSEGKRLFKTHENVRVIDLIRCSYGVVALVQQGCTKKLVVSEERVN